MSGATAQRLGPSMSRTLVWKSWKMPVAAQSILRGYTDTPGLIPAVGASLDDVTASSDARPSWNTKISHPESSGIWSGNV